MFMTTRQLYYLVTIADCGNLSKATQILGVSQPALSKFLADFESSIGFLLFLRHRRQLTPTAVGRYVIDCAQKILDEQTRLLQTLRVVTGSEHTRIRLATAPNRAAIIYSRVYNRFLQRYPDIVLTLTELFASDQPGAILHGQIDISIGSGQSSDKITEIPIAYEELLLSLPTSHPLSKCESVCLSDLKDTPFVLQGARHSIRALAEELFKTAGFEPVVAFESNDVILVDSMLHQAVGAGLVSQAHVSPCEELVYLPLDPPIHQTLYIRYPLGHTLTESERYLAGLLVRERLSDSRYKPIQSEEVNDLLKATEDSSGPFLSAKNAVAAYRFTASDINLDIDLLQYIIAIADEKSLTKAAEKHYLTQPALSRYLSNIENMLCASLFSRIHNRLQPNNAGKIFVNFARNILKIETEMNQYIQTYRQGHGGAICLHCDPALSSVVNQRILPKFQRIHPDVKLSIIEGDRENAIESLLNASVELGLYFSCEDEHPVLNCQPLFKAELAYCFGKTGEEILPHVIQIPNSMPNRSFMLSLSSSSLYAEQCRLIDQLFVTAPQIICEAQDDILKLLSQKGAADTILPRNMLSGEALERSYSFYPPQNYSLIAAFHPARSLPQSVKDLLYLLESHFQGGYSPFSG